MNIGEIIRTLNSEGLSYDLYFSRKLRTGYASFSPNVDKQIYDDLFHLIMENLNNCLEKEQVPYNPTGHRDGTLEVCSCEYIENYQDILSSFEMADTVETEIDPDNFSFYCITIRTTEGENIKLYRRVTKFKKLNTKGLVARFSGRVLNKVESKLIGLDGDIDIVVYKNEILIISHYSLERIFSLKDKFLSTAQNFLEEIETDQIIENFSSFKDDCLNDGRFIKTLTKMSDENIDMQVLINKFDNVKKTIDMFDLQIEIEETSSKIIYTDKNQINDILRIIRDCYYISLINEEKGVDNKI
ncbi:Kiwa anti-phage protein KwaB-like domain-containing protein [Fusobacterium varium]|uniref:Kiwa anti-phage protein KwaB-like domain-containing protein n=1 Tax=Fusobacterium varium TaxID=856 RepID=UPI001F17A2C7|nr:Kiwa anti-phage protein KwaB-like domain-containing protein [Fusobacterium varium]MCF2673372.1 DUF4868 domain-containing protein [Fusobacterium varium]